MMHSVYHKIYVACMSYLFALSISFLELCDSYLWPNLLIKNLMLIFAFSLMIKIDFMASLADTLLFLVS